MKRLNRLVAGLLGLALFLNACGDSATPTGTTSTTPTAKPATTVAVSTTASATTTNPAATTAPVTTVASTTSVATTVTATTQAALATTQAALATTQAALATTQAATTASTTTTAAAANAGQFPVTVKDGAGANVTLTKAPQRIICLSGDCASILFQLGLEPIALPNYSFDYGDPVMVDPKYYGSIASKFIRIGGAPGQPDAEQIASLKPDLIIVDNTSQTIDIYRGIAPTYATAYKDINEDIQTLRGVGQLTGRSQQAETAIKYFQDRLSAYAAKSPKTKKILYLQIYNLSFVPFDTSSTGQLLKQITPFPWHLDNDTTTVGWAPLSLEKTLEVNPDVIFVGGFVGSTITAESTKMFDDSKQKLTASPLWRELNAVKNNQIFEVNSYPWAGIGVLSLNQIMDDAATKLYPEVFPKPLP